MYIIHYNYLNAILLAQIIFTNFTEARLHEGNFSFYDCILNIFFIEQFLSHILTFKWYTLFLIWDICAAKFSCPGMSDSLPPNRLQHTRLPCPSLTPRAGSNSCTLSLQCHSKHLILCNPILFLFSTFPSIRVFF